MCLIRSSIRSLRRYDLEPNDEIMVVEVRPSSGQKMTFVLCYRTPSASGIRDDFINNLSYALAKLRPIYEHIQVLGDFKFPKAKCCLSDIISCGTVEGRFCDKMQENFLTQINFIPSRKGCDIILDPIFTTTPDRASSVTESSNFYHTDHKLLQLL